MDMDATTTDLEVRFEQDKTGIYTSAHYIFHFRPGSLAEEDIHLIAQIQEQSFEKICCTLQINYQGQIHYYLTDSPLEIGQIFWGAGASCNGCALFWKNTIYAVYNETIKCLGSHEDTHVIAYQIGSPESDFLIEGLAMAMDGLWWGLPNEVWTSYYKKQHPSLSAKALLDNDAFTVCESAISYPLAGAFCKYLINVYGIDRFIALYRQVDCEYDACFCAVFGISMSEAESDFWASLTNKPYDTALLEQILHVEGY